VGRAGHLIALLILALSTAGGCSVTTEGYQFSATISASSGMFRVDSDTFSLDVNVHVWWERFDSMNAAAQATARRFLLIDTDRVREVRPGFCSRLCSDPACIDGLIVIENVRVQLGEQVVVDGTCEDIDGISHSIVQ
jgi:hypothetical protein